MLKEIELNKPLADRLLEEAASDKTIAMLRGTLKQNDEEAYEHCTAMAQIVAQCISLSEKDILEQSDNSDYNHTKQVETVKGALIADIGKAYLPFGLQHMHNKLEAEEKEIIKMHPLTGKVAIKSGGFSKIVNDIVLMHHANADGTGYPVVEGKIYVDAETYRNKLETKREDADEIDNLHVVPDYVWIVAYADRFDAMTSKRAFKFMQKSYTEAWANILEDIQNNKLPYKYKRIFGRFVDMNTISTSGSLTLTKEDTNTEDDKNILNPVFA